MRMEHTSHLKSARLVLATVILVSAVISACGSDEEGGNGDGGEQPSAAAINPADFQATVDNPLFPLVPGTITIHEGEEGTEETTAIRVESTVLTETETVAGVEVTVVEVREFEDGELVESTLDYYAQHKDGTVYYMGERVDDYEDGQLVGHSGQWLAGEGENQPGIFMPADPQVGDEFEQERAPGVAEDRSTIVAVGESVTVPAGAFENCIKTEDFAPLDNATEFKFYCPDVGLVREEGEDVFLDLISTEKQ
jgi:hypothetical protein